MKSDKTTTTYKLVKRFDKELKVLLMNDLKTLKGVNSQFLQSNTQARGQVRLSVA
jgi:hypothetical protein